MTATRTFVNRPVPNTKYLNPEDIPKAIETLLLPDKVEELARKARFVERERKIHPYEFLITLVLGFGIRLQRTLSSLRNNYYDLTKIDFSESAWHDRFNKNLIHFLKDCVALAMTQMANEVNRTLSPKLDRFKDILIQDSTVIRLCAALIRKWPATRSRKPAAGLKVSMLISAVAAGPQKVAIHGERLHDSRTLRIGEWVKDRILLVDLGFFKFRLFARIDECGGYFVSRLKENANPLFVSSLRVHRGQSIEIAGKHWKEIKDRLARSILDAEVEVGFAHRAYNGKRSRDVMPLRLVAVYNAEAERYHVYITNIKPDVLSAEDVAELYRVRWDIEMLFKELKSRYSFDEIKSADENVVEGLIWVGILTLLVSRRLFNVLRKSAPVEMAVRYTPMRWATTFVETAHNLQLVLKGYFGFGPSYDEELKKLAWLYEISTLDPHINRHRLPDGWFH
jgi:putative transposase